MTSIVFLTIAVVSLVETLNSALRGRHSGPTAADSAVLRRLTICRSSLDACANQSQRAVAAFSPLLSIVVRRQVRTRPAGWDQGGNDDLSCLDRGHCASTSLVHPPASHSWLNTWSSMRISTYDNFSIGLCWRFFRGLSKGPKRPCS